MQAYRRDVTLEEDGTLTLTNLPLQAGADVEVIILVQPSPVDHGHRFPLRGTPVTYLDPTEPVAETDWEAAQ